MSGRVRIDPSSRLPADAPLPPVPALPVEPNPPSPYVELAVRSCFSFLQAASPPAELVDRARALGYDALALTDRDGLYGMVRAYERAREQKVRLIVGCQLTVSASGIFGPYDTVRVHVADADGYRHLCRLLTRSHALHPKGQARKKRTGLPKNLYAGLPWNDLLSNASGLWLTLERGSDGDRAEERLEPWIGPAHEAFGERLSVGVHLHKDGQDRARVGWAERIAERHQVPPVACGHVLYAERSGKVLYDVLHCIGEGTTLDAAGRKLSKNAEARLKSPAEMQRLFRDRPAWIARTRTIADACTFDLGSIKYNFPCELDEPVHPGETPDQALRRLTYDGAARKYPAGVPENVRQLLEKELALITTKQIAPYFLSVKTIVDIARQKDILCQGRGSAANSAVCFCLEITAVNPVESQLLFERFLSTDRQEPPDIDVDFEHERREEVIQAIYQKYGRRRAAMVSEVICYRSKSALRDVGKVFGLTLEQVERLSSIVTWWDRMSPELRRRLREAGFDADDQRLHLIMQVATAIQGFPRHLSIHVGGFVVSADDLENVAPIEPATMKDRTVIPWDKDDIDVLGFFKLDVLGLGMLSALRRTFALLGMKNDYNHWLAAYPGREDPLVYDALCKSDTVGVFQIESRAQMAMLPRLLPRRFYDLVIEVAIVRPGPIQGGMVHPYLRRRQGREEIDSPHPLLEPILERTLGVPLFQEQVMQIAIAGAGYSGAEADQLRRDMAAWRRTGRMEEHQQRLAAGFARNGIPDSFSRRLYEQIKGFAEYGFPESHAASFAILVYASAWLKVHQPAAFAAAMVNSLPMGFYSASTLLLDAERHGVEIRPPRIDVSDWDCTLEGERVIRVGLRQVSGLGEHDGDRIVTARATGPFRSIEDLAHRAKLETKALDALAEAGALEPLIAHRREAMWQVRAPRVDVATGTTPSLFAGLEWGGDTPSLPALTRSQTLELDYRRTGLSTGDHPLKLLRPHLPAHLYDSRQLRQAKHGEEVSVAGMVICRQRPGTASGVVFFTLEDEHGFLNVVLYSRVFEAHRHVAVTSSLLLVHGTVERGEDTGEVVHLLTRSLEKLRIDGTDDESRNAADTLDLHAMSRNFH